MRSLLLLLPLGLAVSQSLLIDEKVYTPDREYIYSYETQVVSGVPHHGVQVSGVRIRCDVRLQFRTKTRALMKLENIRVFSILGELVESWPADGLVPETLLVPVETGILATLTGELTKAVKFDYITGKVENVKMDVTEPYWSINIKKAILGTLKLNLNRENEITTRPDAMFTETVPDWEKWIRGDTTTAYRVMEAGISGTCESAYNIMPDAMNPALLKVTKVRNYDNCDVAPVYEQGLLSSLTFILEPIHIKDHVQKSSHADYLLTGTESGFVIQTARMDSRYIVTPMTPENGNMVTGIIQLLTLKTAKPSTGDITPDGTLDVRPNGILYEWPYKTSTGKFWNLDYEGNFGWADMDITSDDKITLIDDILTKVVPTIHQMVSKPALVELKRVAGLMKTLSVDQLMTLCNKYTDIESGKREIVLDLLPTLTTPKVIPVLAHLITENKITTTRAMLSFQLAALTVTPTVETLAWVAPMNKALLQHPSVTSRPMLYNTIVLNSASIVHRFVITAKKHGATPTDIERALTKYVADTMTLAKTATTLSTRIALVKAVTNTGLAAFLPWVEEMIMDKTASPVLRRQAIAAVTKIPCDFWPKVQKMLLPVYMDMTDNRQVREVAFISLIDTLPGPSVLNMIVHIQKNEKSLSVAHLVYTYLCNVARMTLPGLETLARDVRRILPLVRAVSAPVEFSLFGSQNFYFDTNCGNKEMCIGVNMFKSSSNMDLHPSVVQARVYLHWLGRTMRAVETHVWGSGVSILANKLFGVLTDMRGPLTGKTIPEMLETLLSPLKNLPVNLGAVADEINDIIQKLGIVDRPIAENLHIGFALKLFGNEIAFIDITEETIKEWVKTGNVPIIGNIRSLLTELRSTGLTFDIPKILSLGTSSIQIPTPVGVPLFVNVTGMAVTHLTGSVTPTSVSVMEAINYGFSGATPSEVGFKSDIKASMAVQLTGTMGVDLSVLAIGTAYESTVIKSLPLVMDTTLNTVTNKLTFTVTPPTVDTNIGSFDMHGSVFMYTLPPSANTLPTCKALDIWHPMRFEMLNMKYRHTLPYTGMTLESSFRLPVALPRWMPFSWLWTRNQAVWTVSGSEPWQLTIQACIKTASAPVTPWNKFTPNPAVTTPTVLLTSFTLGAKSWPDTGRAKLDFNWAVGQQAWVHHINLMAMLPGLMTEPLTTDVVLSMRKVAVIVQPVVLPESPLPNLAEITMAMGQRKVTMRIIPEDANTVNAAPFVNYALTTLMKSLLEIPPTVTKEHIAKTEKPVVLKMVTETTNIDRGTIELIGGGIYAALYTVLQAPAIPHIDVNPLTVSVTALETHFVIYPVLQKIICVVRAPNQKELVLDLPWFWLHRPAGTLVSIEKPWVVPAPPRTDTPALDKPTNRITRLCSIRPEVSASADWMMTFDAAEFTIPALTTKCEVLLARDCSRNGLFTVLATGLGGAKTIRVLVHNHRVEVAPVKSWMFGNDVTITVDGTAVNVADSTPAILTENGETWAKVTKAADWINVIVWKIGVIVSTNTKNIIVKAGPFYKGYLCGLCGNSNFDMMDDFMGPDMVTYPTAANMILKYVVPSATCSIEEVRKVLGVPETPAPAPCTPVPRTGVVTYQRKTCFTLQPINLCPAHCSPVGDMTKVTRDIYCRNPNNVNTQNMVEESKVGILDLSSKNPSTTLSVDVPTTCVPKV